MAKIAEGIVQKRLFDHLSEQNLLTKQQFGFRHNRSTELAATPFTDDIRKHVDYKNLVGCVFIDFSKAFDTLSHAKLLTKLPSFGITGVELEWFKSYLFNRRQVIYYNIHTSALSSVACGVTQGSILGPLLFLLFSNDIVDNVKNSRIIMYADDTILHAQGKDINMIENALSIDMSSLAAWFHENELILNLKKGKTEAMLFGTAKRLATTGKSLKVKYKEKSINVTTSYKYLGVKLDPTMTMQEHFNSTYKRASSRLSLLSKMRNLLTNEAAKKVYLTMILQVMTYCWLVNLKSTETRKKRLESLENRSTKIVNGNADIIRIQDYKKRHACKFVRRCLDGACCENFDDYFTKIDHSQNTRNNKYLLRLPNLRTEFAKKSAQFMAAKMYNDLTLEIRKESSFSLFSDKLNTLF